MEWQEFLLVTIRKKKKLHKQTLCTWAPYKVSVCHNSWGYHGDVFSFLIVPGSEMKQHFWSLGLRETGLVRLDKDSRPSLPVRSGPQFSKVVTWTEDRTLPMLWYSGLTNMSTRLHHTAWMGGSSIMKLWMAGITNLQGRGHKGQEHKTCSSSFLLPENTLVWSCFSFTWSLGLVHPVHSGKMWFVHLDFLTCFSLKAFFNLFSHQYVLLPGLYFDRRAYFLWDV